MFYCFLRGWNTQIAGLSIRYEKYIFPASFRKFEFGWQLQVEVYNPCGVIKDHHFHTFWIPVGEILLIACDIHIPLYWRAR